MFQLSYCLQQSPSQVLLTTKVVKRSVTPTNPRPAKVRRLTASQLALHSVSDSIQAMATALSGRTSGSAINQSLEAGPLPLTPRRRAAAVQLLSQYEKDLSVNTCSAILSAFHMRPTTADTYIAIDPADHDLCRTWLQGTLLELFPDKEFPDLL